MIPRVDFLEIAKKEKPPCTTKAEFVRAEGLVGIHPSAYQLISPCKVLLGRTLEDGFTIHQRSER